MVVPRLRLPARAKAGRRSRPEVECLEARCLLDTGLYRTIDGTGNNLLHPEWGSTDEQLLRIAPAAVLPPDLLAFPGVGGWDGLQQKIIAAGNAGDLQTWPGTTLTQFETPSNDRALPNRPVTWVAPEMVPALFLPEESLTVVPLLSSKAYAATSPVVLVAW